MHSKVQSRTERAILRLVSDFPGLFGPVGVQLARKDHPWDVAPEAARAGQLLFLLETRGLISHQDLGKGRVVYRMTSPSSRGFGRRTRDAGLRRLEPSAKPPRAHGSREAALR